MKTLIPSVTLSKVKIENNEQKDRNILSIFFRYYQLKLRKSHFIVNNKGVVKFELLILLKIDNENIRTF